MRRACLISAACHAVLLALITLVLHLGPRPLPEPEPVPVDIVSLPQLVQATRAPPAEAAPVPKREAAAINPAPRTEASAEPSRVLPAPPRPAPPLPAIAPLPAPTAVQPAPAPPPPQQVQRSVEPSPTLPDIATPTEKPPLPAPPRPDSFKVAAKPTEPAVPPSAKPLPKDTDKPAAREATPEGPEAKPAPRPAPAPASAAPRTDPRQQAAREPETPKTSDKKGDDSFAALLKSVENLPKRLEAPDARAGRGNSPSVAPPSPSQVSALIASAQRQMEECWRIPAGVRGAENVSSFPVNVKLNPDGTAGQVTLVRPPEGADPAVNQVVVESAKRAAWSCRLQLPQELYSEWKDITFSFNPKQAVAG